MYVGQKKERTKDGKMMGIEVLSQSMTEMQKHVRYYHLYDKIMKEKLLSRGDYSHFSRRQKRKIEQHLEKSSHIKTC